MRLLGFLLTIVLCFTATSLHTDSLNRYDDSNCQLKQPVYDIKTKIQRLSRQHRGSEAVLNSYLQYLESFGANNGMSSLENFEAANVVGKDIYLQYRYCDTDLECLHQYLMKKILSGFS